MIFDVIGYFGAFIYIASYALLSFNKIQGEGATYHILNLLAPVCVLVSLSNSFNAPSAIIQSVWLVLSSVALFRILKNRRRSALIKKGSSNI